MTEIKNWRENHVWGKVHVSAQIQALAWRIPSRQQALTEPSMRHAKLQSPNDKTQIKSEQVSNINQTEAWAIKQKMKRLKTTKPLTLNNLEKKQDIQQSFETIAKPKISGD